MIDILFIMYNLCFNLMLYKCIMPIQDIGYIKKSYTGLTLCVIIYNINNINRILIDIACFWGMFIFITPSKMPMPKARNPLNMPNDIPNRNNSLVKLRQCTGVW